MYVDTKLKMKKAISVLSPPYTFYPDIFGKKNIYIYLFIKTGL